MSTPKPEDVVTRGQGWRYFKCDDCGASWKETCRDYQTSSGTPCPNKECKSRMHGGVSPYKSELDKTIPVDAWGNLLTGVSMVWFQEPKRQS